MNWIPRAALAALLLATCAAPAGAAGLFPFPREVFRLPNGLEVVLMPFPADGLVMDAVIMDVGGRTESKPDEMEYTHLLEHLMFRGSRNYTEARAKDLYVRAGAYEQGFTESDFTCYYRIYPAAAFEKMADLMADKFDGLVFSDDEYKAETGAVLGEYTGHCRQPESRIYNALYRAAFKVHPYRAVSEEEHLATLTRMPDNRARVMAFYERYYKPNNARLVVGGSFDPVLVRRLVTEKYGRLKPGEAVPPLPAEPPSRKEVRVALSGEPDAAPRLAIAWHIPGYDPDDPDVCALDLLAKLHFDRGGALEKQLTLEKGLAASVDFPHHFFSRDPNLFTILITLKRSGDLPAVERLVLDFVAGLSRNRVRPARLEAVKKKARYGALVRYDALDPVMFGFLGPYFLSPRVDAVDRQFERLAAATPEQLRMAARRVFRSENRIVVTFTPGPGEAVPGAKPGMGEPK